MLGVCGLDCIYVQLDKKRKCGRKKQRQIQVIVTPKVECNMVGTKRAPENSDIFHSTRHRNGKVRD